MPDPTGPPDAPPTEYTDPTKAPDEVDVVRTSSNDDRGYVMVKHSFNRFEDEEVPTLAKPHIRQIPTGPPKDRQENGKCWTEQEFEFTEYITHHFIKKRWIEWWAVNPDLEFYYDSVHASEKTAQEAAEQVLSPLGRAAGLMPSASPPGVSGAVGTAAAVVTAAAAAAEGVVAATPAAGLAVPAGMSTLGAGAIVSAPAVQAAGAALTKVAVPVVAGVATFVVAFSVTTRIMEKFVESAEKMSEGWEFVSSYDKDELTKQGLGVEIGPIHDCPKKEEEHWASPLPKAEPGFNWPRSWWLWIILGALLSLIVLVALAVGHIGPFSQQSGTMGQSGPVAGNSPPGAAPPVATNAPPANPGPLLNTGAYAGAITVQDDPQGHAPFIGPMPSILDVLFTRGSQTRVVTITISGAAPWVQVRGTGTYDEPTGDFTATGSGTVTSRNIPVTASFTGTLKNGVLAGAVIITGTPNGPITYHVQTTK